MNGFSKFVKATWILLFFSFYIGILGLVPHLRFSSEIGRQVYFKSGFDEDTYIERILGNVPPRMDRQLSELVFKTHLQVFRTLDLALIAMDFTLPFAASLFIFLAVFLLLQSQGLALLFGLLILFGQDFLSTGNMVIWPGGTHVWEWFPKGWAPICSTSFFSIFRTPETQSSLVTVGFFSIFLADIFKKRFKIDARVMVFYAVTLFLLPFSYVFVALLMSVFSGLMVVFFVLRKKLNLGILFFGLSIFGILGTLLGMGGSGVGDTFFESKQPIFTIAQALSLLFLLILILQQKRKFLLQVETIIPVFFFLVPLILMNQQVFTHRMISSRDFEINLNFISLGLGIAFYANQFPFKKYVKVFALLAGVVILATATYFQNKVYSAWFEHNFSSVQISNLIREIPNLKNSKVVLKNDLGTAPLIRLRLESAVHFLAYYNDVQLEHIAPLKDRNDTPLNRDLHGAKAYEFFRRNCFSAEEFESVLRDEIDRKSGQFFLAYYFSALDFWYPQSDDRMVKEDWIRHQIPELRDEFAKSLANKIDFQSENSFIITRNELAHECNGFQNELIKKTDRFFVYMQFQEKQ